MTSELFSGPGGEPALHLTQVLKSPAHESGSDFEAEFAERLSKFHQALVDRDSMRMFALENEDLSTGQQNRLNRAQYCVARLEQFRKRLQPTQHESITLTSTVHSSEAFRIAERFQIRRRIGTGGMGTVFECFDTERNEVVAIKAMRNVDAVSLYFFKREFRLLTGIIHENLVRLHDLFCAAGNWFFSMEFLVGLNFYDAVRGILSVQTAREACSHPSQFIRCRDYLLQLTAGLDFLHQSGRVHRDIKPSNVMVTELGRTVILDMGLITEHFGSGSEAPLQLDIVGTLAYMSPEQIRGDRVGPASDWFSVGVMLYETLTGRLPKLTIASESELFQQSLLNFAPEIPDDLRLLCEILLDYRPEYRLKGRDLIREFQSSAGRKAANKVAGSEPLNEQPRKFVGRHNEMSQLLLAIEQMRGGHSVIVEVEGRSGYGKSALLVEYLSKVKAFSDVVVLSARCYERESLPYKAVDNLVDALGHFLQGLSSETVERLLPHDTFALRRIFPVLRRVAAIANASQHPFDINNLNELRRRAFIAFHTLLVNVAAFRPLCLVIDDFQWGDADGGILLRDLFHPSRMPPVLLVISYRREDAESSPSVAALRELLNSVEPRPLWHQVPVEALSENEVAEICEQSLVSDAPKDLTADIVREAGGNPYFVHELIRHVSSMNGTLAESCERIELKKIVLSRFNGISLPARLLLEVIAVSGGPVLMNTAGFAAGIQQVPVYLDELRLGRLIRVTQNQDGSSLETSHDRIREAIVAEIPNPRRLAHHHQLGLALEASNDLNWEVIAAHFEVSGHPARACVYFAMAAERATESLAFERAAELFEHATTLRQQSTLCETSPNLQAVTMTDHRPLPDEWCLIKKRGAALGYAGRGADAARVLLEASELAPAAEHTTLIRQAALQLCASGHVDRGRELFREVLKQQGVPLHSNPIQIIGSILWQRGLLWWRGMNCTLRTEQEIDAHVLDQIDALWDAVSGLLFPEPIVVSALQSRELLLALKAGEPRRLIRSLALEAIIAAVGGTRAIPRCEVILSRAKALATQREGRETESFMTLAEGTTAFLQVRMVDALEKLSRSELLFEQSPTRAWWEQDMVRSLIVWAHMHIGNYRQLETTIERYLNEAEQRGDRLLIASIHTAGLPQLKLRDGQPLQAARIMREVQSRFPSEVYQQQHVSWLFSQAQIDLYLGDGISAWNRIMASWSRLRRSMQLRNQFARVSLIDLRARGVLQAGSPKSIARAKRDLSRLRRERGEWVSPYVHRLDAGIAAAEGRLVDASAALLKGQLGFQSIGFKLCAAALQCKWGNLNGGGEGKLAIELGTQLLQEEGIRAPESMGQILAYGRK